MWVIRAVVGRQDPLAGAIRSLAHWRGPLKKSRGGCILELTSAIVWEKEGPIPIGKVVGGNAEDETMEHAEIKMASKIWQTGNHIEVVWASEDTQRRETWRGRIRNRRGYGVPARVDYTERQIGDVGSGGWEQLGILSCCDFQEKQNIFFHHGFTSMFCFQF